MRNVKAFGLGLVVGLAIVVANTAGLFAPFGVGRGGGGRARVPSKEFSTGGRTAELGLR